MRIFFHSDEVLIIIKNSSIINPVTHPVIILGGGISGLATARFLRKKNIPFLLIEKEPKTGGKIQSEIADGTIFDFGPNTIRDKTGTILQMVEELGILDEIISISEASKTRYLVRDGKLNRILPNLKSVISTDIISRKGKFRALKEPFIPAGPNKEESVGAFLERRFGLEIVDYVADPIYSGIYAGDVNKLSKTEIMPQLAEYEQKYGSITQGLLRSRKGKISQDSKPSTFTFKQGIQQLTDALTSALSYSIIHDEVKVVKKTDESFRISTKQKEFECQELISCLPAYALAEVLEDKFSNLSRILKKIEYAPILTTQVVFDKQNIQTPESGFGFLVPRKENFRLLGAIWNSSIFPELSAPDKLHFNLLAGGATDKEIIDKPVKDVEDQVLDEFSNLMNISAKPLQVKSKLWEKAIPQFNMGYNFIRNDLAAEVAKFDGLKLGSNFLWGVSVPECVEGAKNLVDTFNSN